MNRKLQHTLKALSATAAVFTALLLAGGPATPAMPLPAAPLSGDNAALLDTAVDASVDGASDASETSPSNASRLRHMRHSRALLALPYFSFAQGLRRNRS